MAEEALGITEISVAGFKSIEKGSIEIRPLTILAGANSSGKSSIIQPMLLMKQTLDDTTDPGPLRLDGPHVHFTKYEQFLHKTGVDRQQVLTVGYEFSEQLRVNCEFTFSTAEQVQQRNIELTKMKVVDIAGATYEMTPQMTRDDLARIIPKDYFSMFRTYIERFEQIANANAEDEIVVGVEVNPSRCFLFVNVFNRKDRNEGVRIDSVFTIPLLPIAMIRDAIKKLIHVPGLRGNPQRGYQFTPVRGPEYSGFFQNYTASLLWRWQEEGNDNLKEVRENLTSLGLTNWVKAERVDDVKVRLTVDRLPVSSGTTSKDDSVDIADVGFGVSQVLPVLVALAVAEPGQMVYIEQPELHLHPRAQVAMAEVLSDAVKRGVRVVVETHSPLLLQGVMTLIAEDKLESDKVVLHWFRRTEEGKTKITPGSLDENGAYGDWPEDFADVELGIQGRYLDAVAEREMVV